ncbi:LysR family transcriptional regulator [Pseudochelatococcus sp. B33]
MSIAQLRAFHFVARYGGFSHAAREMAVSQSTLSGQVKTLEATCGISLFERHTRGVKLSEQGEVLFEITSRLFQAEAEAKTFLRRRPETDHAGYLRVAADGPVLALPILVGMRRERPKLTFSLSIDNSDRVTDQILGYHADVGITALPPRDSRLHGVYLLSMPVGLCVSRDHGLAGRPFVMLKDLAGHSFVLRERGSRTRAAFEENLAAADVKIGTVIEISSREGVREAVANGLGCGVVADREFGADPRLVFVPIKDARAMIDEYAICLTERLHLPLIKAFLQEAQGRDALPPPFGHDLGNWTLRLEQDRGRTSA